MLDRDVTMAAMAKRKRRRMAAVEWDGEKQQVVWPNTPYAGGWVAGSNEDRTCREGRHDEGEKQSRSTARQRGGAAMVIQMSRQ